MKKVIFSIGIPGSGKTTVMKSFAERYDYVYICPDDIRAEINGDPSSQANMHLVWEIAYSRLREALEQGRTVVFDSTMARQSDRERFIKYAEESGAEKIQGLYFRTPLEVAKERNMGRSRRVPEHVLDQMRASLDLDAPSNQEGIRSLFSIDENGRITSIDRIDRDEQHSEVHPEKGDKDSPEK